MPFKVLDNWTDPADSLPKAAGELNRPAPSPEYGLVQGFSDSWKVSRELDSTLGAMNRITEENNFAVDPTYNLQNLDELMEDIPVSQQEFFQKRLLTAKSADHATYIKERYQFETQKEEELAGYGGWGLAARIGVNIFDESALLLGLASGPAAAAFKYSRVKRAIGVAGIAGLENAATEAIIKQGSQTRTYDDIIIAGLMGVVLGGAIGAVTKGGSRSQAGPGEAEQARKGLEDMDNALAAEIAGHPAPPLSPATKAMNMEQALDIVRITAPVSPRKPVTPPTPTKGEAPETPTATAKAPDAESAPDTTARRAEIDARVEELAKADVPVVKAPRSIDMLPTVRTKVEELIAAKAALQPGDAKGRVALTRLEQEVQTMKRDFIKAMKADDVDAFNASGLSDNPKMDAFSAFMGKPADKILKGIKKTSEKAQAESDKAFKAIDDEVDALTKEAAELDSVGAARVEGKEEVDLDQITEAEGDLFASAPRSAFNAVRMGFYSILNRSENIVHKHLGHILSRDSVGNADGTATVRSAEEISAMHNDVVIARYAKEDNAAYAEWLVETDQRLKGAYSSKVRTAYNKLVTAAIESGGDDSAAVMKSARATTRAISETLNAAKEGGVRGFEGLTPGSDYMPHIHNTDAWTSAAQKYQSMAGAKKAPLTDLVYKSLKSALDIEGDDVQLLKLAKKYVHNVRTRAAGLHGSYGDITRTTDPEYLRGLLKDVDADDDLIDYVTNMMRASEEAKAGKGVTARAKSRVLLDMDSEVQVRNKETGDVETLRMRDLFEQDSQKLMMSYVRSVGGLASIAKRTKGTALHIRGEEDFERALRLGARHEADSPRTKDNFFTKISGHKGSAAESEQEMLRMAWNSIVGRPINDPTDAFTTFTRRVSDYNFARVMGQVAWAQFAEFGPVVSKMGFGGMIRAIPEFRSAMTRGPDGKLNSELAAVAEEWLGTGTEWSRGKYNYVMYADPEAYGASMEGIGATFDTAMHHVNRVVAGPLLAMMTGQQRMLAIGMLHNFGKRAKTGKVLSEAKMRTLGSENISASQLDAINAQFVEHGTYKGNKLVNPNFEKWDPDSRDAILGSLFQMGRRAVQQNDIGNINPLLKSSRLAKLGFQFRTFIMGAWEKHLLHGLNNPKDLENFAGLALSTMFSGIAYVGQTYSTAAGMDQQAKAKFIKKRLSDDNVAAHIFGRTTHASMIPTIVDTMRSLGGLDPMFSRTSGQDTNFISGNPTVDLLSKSMNAISGGMAAATQSDYDYSQQDVRNARYSLPFANLLGAGNMWNIATQDLPQQSERGR